MKENKKIFETIKKIGVLRLGIILAVGIFLVALETGGTDELNNNILTNTENTTSIADIDYTKLEKEYVAELENKIKSIILTVSGVTQARVYITLEGGIRKVTLTETPYSNSSTTESDKNGGTRIANDEEKSFNTVYTKDENGNEEPFIVCVKMPEVKGVAVSIKGTVSVTDKKNIIDMINVLTGIGINNISVIY